MYICSSGRLFIPWNHGLACSAWLLICEIDQSSNHDSTIKSTNHMHWTYTATSKEGNLLNQPVGFVAGVWSVLCVVSLYSVWHSSWSHSRLLYRLSFYDFSHRVLGPVFPMLVNFHRRLPWNFAYPRWTLSACYFLFVSRKLTKMRGGREASTPWLKIEEMARIVFLIVHRRASQWYSSLVNSIILKHFLIDSVYLKYLKYRPGPFAVCIIRAYTYFSLVHEKLRTWFLYSLHVWNSVLLGGAANSTTLPQQVVSYGEQTTRDSG